MIGIIVYEGTRLIRRKIGATVRQEIETSSDSNTLTFHAGHPEPLRRWLKWPAPMVRTHGQYAQLMKSANEKW